MTRRSNSVASFATPISGSSLLRAQEKQDESSGYNGPFYVVFNASGGWDTTYLMDPKGIEGIRFALPGGGSERDHQIRNHRCLPVPGIS